MLNSVNRFIYDFVEAGDWLGSMRGTTRISCQIAVEREVAFG